MRSCTHPGSAVGSRPCWRHQLTVCGLLFYLNPHSRIVFWSDCKSSNSASETAQVLKLANGSAAICFPTIYGELAHIVSLPERDWAQAASLSAQPGPNKPSRGWICGKHRLWWQMCGPQLARSQMMHVSDNQLYIRWDLPMFTQADSRGDRVAHHFIKQNLSLQLWAEE